MSNHYHHLNFFQRECMLEVHTLRVVSLIDDQRAAVAAAPPGSANTNNEPPNVVYLARSL